MKLKKLYETLFDKEVLKWFVSGILIYGAPAIYRAITKNPVIPIFPLIDFQNSYIPDNIVEKLVVNSFAPGGFGAKYAEKYFEEVKGKLNGIKKYFVRVIGSVSATSIWATLQYIGYNLSNYLNLQWPSGGNPFEPPTIYPFNILIALTLAPLTPYLIERLKRK